ncbi:hypothetical protein NL676_010152 [Syzygium grande]|nr:hypothetical protein NL676_010152 [Syzygium grande]
MEPRGNSELGALAQLLTDARHSGNRHNHDDVHMKGRPKTLHTSDKKSQGAVGEQDHTTSVVKFRDECVNKMRQKERLMSNQLKRENAEAKQEMKHFPETPSHSSKSLGKTHRRRRRNDSNTGSPRKLPHPMLVDGPSQSTFRGLFCHQVHPRSGGGIGCRSISVAENKYLKKTNVQSLHRNEAAEALVNQKFVNGGHFGDDRTGHKSKQFLEALHVLNSNKQLFSKLLDDRDSVLAKHIQELRDSQEKEQKCESTIDTSVIQEKSTGMLSWKKIKGWGKLRPKRSSEEHFSIVVLGPGLQSAGNIEKSGSSPQTNNSIRNEVPAIRQSHFPFRGLRRKTRNATELRRTEKGQMPKFSVDIEKKGNAGEHNSPRAKIGRESATTGGGACPGSHRDHKEVNFNMAEARIHRSQPLRKDLNKKVSEEQFINTRRRSLSLPGQDLLSFLNSGRTEEVGMFTAQMRFSSYSYYLNNQNRLGIHKENENNVPSPLRPNEEVPTLNDDTCRNPDDPFNHAKANLEMQEKLLETEMHEITPFPFDSGSEDISLPCKPGQAPSNQAHLGIAEESVIAETTNNMLPNSVNPFKEPAALNCGPYCCANQNISATKDPHKGECLCCFELDSPLQNQPETSLVDDSLLRATNAQNADNVITSGTTVSLDRTMSEPADPPSGSPEIALVTSPSDSKFSANKADDKLGFTSEYVRSLLIYSDLNWNELLVKYPESEQFLPPFLFSAIGTQPDRSGIDHMLLFDYVDEILQEVANEWYFRFLRLNTKMVPPDENVAREAIKWVDWNLVFRTRLGTLEQLIEEDLAKPQVWVDTRKDAEGIVNKMVESILEDIIEEME